MLFLSTYEATDKDGSTRNPTKSIADPYVVNTVVTRARSLVVSVGNPYMLLNMEKHMCKKYGEKAKYWSNYIKRCLEQNSITFHNSTEVFDADKQGQLDRLKRAVEKQIAAKYNKEESETTIINSLGHFTIHLLLYRHWHLQFRGYSSTKTNC